MTQEQQTIEELWHNLYRMHSYLEAVNAPPGIMRNANLLLKTSRGRVEAVLIDTRRLEPDMDNSP